MKQVYYGGLRKGFNRKTRKYNILNQYGQPLSNCPLDKVRFFKYPFGRLGIIAHVSIYGELWAMDIKGRFYDMNTFWKSRYLLKNEWKRFIGQIITEVLHNYLRKELIAETNNPHQQTTGGD